VLEEFGADGLRLYLINSAEGKNKETADRTAGKKADDAIYRYTLYLHGKQTKRFDRLRDMVQRYMAEFFPGEQRVIQLHHIAGPENQKFHFDYGPRRTCSCD